MKPLARLLLFVTLAAIGYVAGTRFPLASLRASTNSISEGVPASPAGASTSNGPLRDPRTGATFAESIKRLKELARPDFSPGRFLQQNRAGKAYLEIERIFALATREEMLTYFASEDLAKLNPTVASLAYARLADLSLDDAKAVWSDQYRRTGKGNGVDGLVYAWAKLDPTGAEPWVDQIADRKLRDVALVALLDGAMEIAPDLVERRLADVGGMFESIELAGRLAGVVDPARLPLLADRVFTEKQGRWEYQNQLVAVLESWGERDGKAMMAWLLARPAGSLQDHVIHRIAQARAKSDPAAFAREIGPSLADNDTLAEMAGQAWLEWLEQGIDDKGALEWFQAHGEHLDTTSLSNWIYESWTTEKSSRVLSLLSDLPEGNQRADFTKAILNRLSHTDAKSALALGKDLLPSGKDRNWFLASTLNQLAAQGDPEGALDWAVQNIDPGEGQNQAIRFVMSSWSNKNPLLAAQNAQDLPGKLRDEALNGIASQWAETAPEQLVKFLKTAPDPSSMTKFARSAFWSLGYNRGGESHLDAAMDLPNEALRKEAISGLFSGWASANAESSAAALQTLERGPLRDLAITEFANQVGSVDREAAFAWSLEIADPAKRREIALRQGRQWLASDREAAERWIAASEVLSDEWKAELRKPAK